MEHSGTVCPMWAGVVQQSLSSTLYQQKNKIDEVVFAFKW